MSTVRFIPPQIAPNLPGATPAKPAEVAPEKESFGEFLSGAMDNINQLQTAAGEAQDKLVHGEAAELHQVMIAAEKAGISFDLLLEIRKKLLDAYQEIMRMPI